MPFCTSCGAEANGRFCPKCGAPVGGAAPVAAAAPRRRTSPWVWVAVVLGSLILLAGIGVVGGTWFLAHKLRQSGHAATTLSRLALAANPNLELVEIDEERGSITLRNKRTGKVTTIHVRDGERALVKIESDEGNVEAGANASELPSWVPVYPGVKPRANSLVRGSGSVAGTMGFHTSDAPADVLAFFDKKLKAAGFEVTQVADQLLTAKRNDQSVVVHAAASGGGTDVNLTFKQ